MRQPALDLLGIAGAGIFLTGVWQVYPPAALIVGGLGAMAAALYATRSSS